MSRFLVRFQDLLTPGERERLAELNEKGFSQFIRDDVNNTADDEMANLKLAINVAAYVCIHESFERQEVVTKLLLKNQNKSRRMKAVRGLMGLLFCCGALYAIVKLVIWLVNYLLL
jgi:hypothetical protein